MWIVRLATGSVALSERVTIKSIARDLGISHMTVSRALGNHVNVKPETRALVHKRATELGYIRNAAAATIRGGTTRIVGLLVPTITNEFYAAFASELSAACDAANLHLMIHLTNDNPDKELFEVTRLREQEVGAVIMVPAPDGRSETERYLEGIRVVQMIRTRNPSSGTARLLIDEDRSIVAAIDLLAAKGHRRIAFICGHDALSSGRRRLHAYREGMLKNGIEPCADLVATGVPSFAMGMDRMEALARMERRASAVVCGGFEISNGALEACLRLGLSMPDDLAFVGFGDPPFYRWIQGGITTVALPVKEMTAAAIAHLDTPRKEGKDAGYAIPVCRSRLIERTSA